MLKRLHDLAEQRTNFAFESTLASRSYARWLNRLRQDAYSLHIFFLWLRSPEIAIERVKERVQLGGHDVPEIVIRRRYHRGIANFLEIYRLIADSWLVYDNSGSVEPLLIANGTNAEAPAIDNHQLWLRFCEAEGDGE